MSSCKGGQIVKRKHQKGYHIQYAILEQNRHPNPSIQRGNVEEAEKCISTAKLKLKQSNQISQNVFSVAVGNNAQRCEAAIDQGNMQGSGQKVFIPQTPLISKVAAADRVQQISHDKNRKTETTWAMFACLAAIGGIGILFRRRANKLKSWALSNRKKAAWLSAGLQIGLATDALILGTQLKTMGYQFNYDGSVLAAGGSVALAALSLLGRKNKRKWGRNRVALTAAPLLVAAAYLNPASDLSIGPQSLSYSPARYVIEVAGGESVTEISRTGEAEPEKAYSTGSQVALTIAMIIGVIAAVAVLLAISCGLFCYGYVTLPILLLAFGIPSVLFFAVAGLKHVFTSKKGEKTSFEKVMMYIALAIAGIAATAALNLFWADGLRAVLDLL